ncbi:transglutaminase-like domain-containing protein [Carboxylicivirga caseinilyticus]|uniref:transglutaminase-like domain-containing protein n=1 Tax=Carboxylicivirga caseinilyticus TaxID=3417572 RepID=UPI003D326D60|nr:transglutaminase family protein [Marinilabiliaceae bacterium A049]
MKKERIKALITLLDDPNEEVFSSVENELLKQRVDIVPELEEAWENSLDDLLQGRIESLIHNIQLKDIYNELKKWLKTKDRDLLQGVYLVSKYQYPELVLSNITDVLAQLKKEIWLQLNEHLTSLEKIRIINHVLFDLHKYSRNTNRFLAPENNFVSEVLTTRKGNPITLSIIYSLLCNQLGMPVFGVNLPKNFILAFLDDSAIVDEGVIVDTTSVMFYINPINKGAVLGKKEIEYFIKQQKLEPREEYFLPCDNAIIVRRLFNNLINAYENKGDETKKKEIAHFLTLFSKIK